MGSDSEKLPLYLRIKQDIKTRIENGDLPEGARVPSEMELAEIYKVSRNPTRQALRELDIEGYITRTRRRGSFVAPAARRSRQLVVTQGRVIAVVCPHVRSPHVRGIVEGFVHEAGARGFHAMVYFMDCTDKNQADLLQDIRQSGLAGVALWLSDAVEQTIEVLVKFRKNAFPFVLIDRFVRGREWDSVVTDNEHLSHALTQGLIARGHKHIAFFSTAQQNTSNEERLAGFQRAMLEAGLACPEELLAVLDPNHPESPHEVDRVLAHKSRPTAFMCTQGWIALTAARELNRLGYAVPGDIEFASIDDGDLSSRPNLPVVTGRQQSYEIGRAGAEVLIGRIEAPLGAAVQHRLKPIVVAGLPEAPAA